jgi:hypothetical protein
MTALKLEVTNQEAKDIIAMMTNSKPNVILELLKEEITGKYSR